MMAAAIKAAGRTTARRWAACLIMLAGLGGASVAYAQSASDLGFAPPPGTGPAAPPPGYGAQGAPPPAGYAPGPAAAPGAARGRGITRAEFIERRRAAATKNGRDPERAAANAARMFDRADTNHDGIVDSAERAAFEAANPRRQKAAQ